MRTNENQLMCLGYSIIQHRDSSSACMTGILCCSSNSFSKYLPPVIKHQSVTLAGVELSFTIRKCTGHVLSHAQGHSGILFPLPEVDLCVNVCEPETPGARGNYHLPGHSAYTIAVGFY